MLRNVVLGGFVLLLAAALVAAFADGGAWPAVVGLAGVVAAILFERRRYADRIEATPREPLSPTRERFIDPETGRPVQVWSNARGERHYVEEPGPED
jgi:hypothetical protein